MRQTTEIIEGTLSEAPTGDDARVYRVNVEAIRTLFEGGGRNYEFRILDMPSVPVGVYYAWVNIDGQDYGIDIRVLPNPTTSSTEVRWAGSS